jgi:hypothetical protein
MMNTGSGIMRCECGSAEWYSHVKKNGEINDLICCACAKGYSFKRAGDKITVFKKTGIFPEALICACGHSKRHQAMINGNMVESACFTCGDTKTLPIPTGIPATI